MGKGIKILLIHPNTFMDNMIPIGIPLLSACLKNAGHETKLFDTTFYQTRAKTGDDYRAETLQISRTNLQEFGIDRIFTDMVDDFRKLIQEYQPQLIGFSVIDITWPIALKLLRSISDCQIPTIVGGVHAMLSPEDVIQGDSVDMVCVGEGEEAIVELADCIRDGRDYSNVRNLWVKANGGIIRNELRDLRNLDDNPIPDRSIFEEKRFYKPMRGKVWVMAAVELDRSCPHSCTYCANEGLHAIYRDKGRYYRQRSIEKTIEEVLKLQETYGIEYVYFVAANFLHMNEKRFQEFIQKYKNIKIPFYIDTRPETITKERVVALEAVGCKSMAIGLEHGDEEFRKKYLRRNIKNESIINAVDIVKTNSNIKISVNNIIGFPYETRELVFKTIELNRKINADSRMVNIFNPYAGTELREVSIREGFISAQDLAGDYRSDVVLNMPQFPKNEIAGMQRTFIMYSEFPKYMYPLIQKAEADDEVFRLLSSAYEQYKQEMLL